MSNVFKGQYDCSIDPDGRIELPTPYREIASSPRFTITRGFQTCLFVYSADQWQAIEDQLRTVEPGHREARDFYRNVLRWAFDSALDEHGRLAIPQPLRDFAQLEEEALVLGAFDHIEIWAPPVFTTYVNQSRHDYGTLAGYFFGNGRE